MNNKIAVTVLIPSLSEARTAGTMWRKILVVLKPWLFQTAVWKSQPSHDRRACVCRVLFPNSETLSLSFDAVLKNQLVNTFVFPRDFAIISVAPISFNNCTPARKRPLQGGEFLFPHVTTLSWLTLKKKLRWHYLHSFFLESLFFPFLLLLPSTFGLKTCFFSHMIFFFWPVSEH